MANSPELIKAVTVLAKMTGWDLDKDTLNAVVTQLSKYPHAPAMAAVNRCMLEHRGPMTLGAIIDRIEDGHLGPETAWALVATIGESETVVWTDEIARAYGVAMPLIGSGELVQARMAFLEAYRIEISRARAEARKPVWFPSLGHDIHGRQGPITKAVLDGKLPIESGKRALPEHLWSPDWHSQPALTDGNESARQDAQNMLRSLTEKLDADRKAELIRKARTTMEPTL